MALQQPVVNLGELYVQNLQLTNDGTTPDEIVNIAAGQCRDSTNAQDISVSAALDVDNTVSGAGGLDTGSVANSTMYAIYVIGDDSGKNSPVGLMSASLTVADVTMPAGYNMGRRLGYVLTDGTADNLPFDQRGNGKDRMMTYRQSIATDITAGSSASYAAVDLSGSIPAASLSGLFKVTFTPTGANDELHLRCGDSAVAGDSQAVANGHAAAVVAIAMLSCPIGATIASGVDYKVTGSAVAVNVQGYLDQL